MVSALRRHAGPSGVFLAKSRPTPPSTLLKSYDYPLALRKNPGKAGGIMAKVAILGGLDEVLELFG
jgi:hypothetical protein